MTSNYEESSLKLDSLSECKTPFSEQDTAKVVPKIKLCYISALYRYVLYSVNVETRCPTLFDMNFNSKFEVCDQSLKSFKYLALCKKEQRASNIIVVYVAIPIIIILMVVYLAVQHKNQNIVNTAPQTTSSNELASINRSSTPLNEDKPTKNETSNFKRDYIVQELLGQVINFVILIK